MNRVQFLRNLIAQHRQIGIIPCELHMNAATVDDFSRDVEAQSPDSRSVLERMRNAHREPKRLEMFDGLRIVTNEALDGAAIILRPLQLMGDPNWLSHVHLNRPAAPASQDAQQSGTQATHEPLTMPSPQKSEDILAQLTQNAGISPSTVLIKAMEDLDKVEDVIVLRFYRGGAIDLGTTYNKYAVIGALQASLGYVVNRDGE